MTDFEKYKRELTERIDNDPAICTAKLLAFAERRIAQVENISTFTWRCSMLCKARAQEMLRRKLDFLQRDMTALYHARATVTAEEVFTVSLIDKLIELIPIQVKTVVDALENVEDSPFDTPEQAILQESPDGVLSIKTTALRDLWDEADDEPERVAEHKAWVCNVLHLTAEQIEEILSKCGPEGYKLPEVIQ